MITSYNLQKLDNDDSHNGSFWVVKKVCKSQELKTPLYEQSLNGLQEDEFGNIQCQSELEHLVTLHYSAHPVQRSGNDNNSLAFVVI